MFKNIKKIDHGFTSEIYTADLETPTQSKTVAIKVSKDDEVSNYFVTNEIKILSQLSHPNIIGLIDQQANYDVPHMVLEFAENGALDDFLISMQGQWNATENLRSTLALGIACGLEYLHAKKLILHRDIKGANILLDQNYLPKIADFGFSVKLNERFDKYINVTVGTSDWFAPEIAGNQDRVVFTERSDIWAFALLLWQLYALFSPYGVKLEAYVNGGGQINSAEDEVKCISNMILSGEHEDETLIPLLPLRKLVLQAWSFTPSQRPRVEEFVKVLRENVKEKP